MLAATATPMKSASVDARPIIPRNKTNLWTQAESIRDELYGHILAASTRAGLEPLLLKSGPSVFPAWVKFEAWQPRGDSTTTKRSSATLTIEPRPYYHHSFELDVELWTENKSRRFRRVAVISQTEVDKLISHLVNGGPTPRFRRFRDYPFQLWRTDNKLKGLGKDVLATVTGLLAIAGFMLIVVLPVALVLWGMAVFLALKIAKRKSIVKIDGKPHDEPRTLIRVDSWQTVLFDLGSEATTVRERFVVMLEAGLDAQRRFRTERHWYWGLDGKEEREQWVLTAGRGIVFCQIHQYGKDLYVGWDGHLNRGQWVEQTVATGIDKSTRNPITISRVVPGTQPMSEYDLADLSCLMEWVHAQVVKLLKQLINERKIDQEIDFKIQRAERQQVITSGSAAAAEGSAASKVRKAFQRTA